jgi:hypothetical protein
MESLLTIIPQILWIIYVDMDCFVGPKRIIFAFGVALRNMPNNKIDQL